MPNFDMTAWYGLMVPAQTPSDIVQKISKDVTDVLALPDVRNRFASMGVIPGGMTPEAFQAFLTEQHKKLGVFIERNRAQLSE